MCQVLRVGCCLAIAVGAVQVSPLAAEETAAQAKGASAVRAVEPTAEERIAVELEKPTVMEFSETQLGNVIAILKERHPIEIQLDNRALDDAGVGTDTPITRKLRNIKLKSALALMLREVGLTYVVEHEVLLITTEEQAQERRVNRIYDVRDLLDADRQDRLARGDAAIEYDYDSLIDAITSSVSPDSWDHLGGLGSIAPLYGTLVIAQTTQIHERVAELFVNLRRVADGRRAAAAPPGNVAAPPVDPNALVLRVYSITSQGGSLGGGIRGGSDNNQPSFQTFKAALSNDLFKSVQQLAVVIPTVIERDTWREAGGAGVIQAVPSTGSSGIAGALVVRQTKSVHAEIARFLRDLESKGLGAVNRQVMPAVYGAGS